MACQCRIGGWTRDSERAAGGFDSLVGPAEAVQRVRSRDQPERLIFRTSSPAALFGASARFRDGGIERASRQRQFRASLTQTYSP